MLDQEKVTALVDLSLKSFAVPHQRPGICQGCHSRFGAV